MSFVSRADSTAPLGSAGAFKCDTMVKFLRQRQMKKLWSNNVGGEGVILKRGKNDFVCQPSELLFEQNGLFSQVCQLDVKVSRLSLGDSFAKLNQVAMTVKTDVIETFLRTLQLPYVPYLDGLRIQGFRTSHSCQQSRNITLQLSFGIPTFSWFGTMIPSK